MGWTSERTSSMSSAHWAPLICIPTYLEHKVQTWYEMNQLQRVTVTKYNTCKEGYLVKMSLFFIVCNFMSLSFFVFLWVILLIMYIIMQEQISEWFPAQINITELVIHGSQIIIPTEHARVYPDQLYPTTSYYIKTKVYLLFICFAIPPTSAVAPNLLPPVVHV